LTTFLKRIVEDLDLDSIMAILGKSLNGLEIQLF